MTATLEPLQLLYEAPALPHESMPAELERLHGGPFGLAADCVYANFVESLDGVVAIPHLPGSNDFIAGDSDADRFLMGLLRAVADVVLIGAGVLRASPRGTWRADRIYPPAGPGYAELRAHRGLPPAPEVAVLSGSGSIDPAHPLLSAGALVLTTTAGAERLTGVIPEETTIHVLGESPVLSPPVVVEALRARGHRRILCEAGPHAFGTLLAGGAIDELFLTTSPLLVGDAGPGSRLRLVEAADLVGAGLQPTLLGLRRHGSHLFHRYALR